jgi:glycine hydroxymethyltransferase
MMNHPELEKKFPEIYDFLYQEMIRQKEGIELIPSENYASQAVIEALGSHFTNKYSEGYPYKRYYGGQIFTDKIETQAILKAKQLFNAEYANVQALSGAIMNIAVYFALLDLGDVILGMDLSHGGHLTHGHPVTHMAKVFKFERYKTDLNNEGVIDYDDLFKKAQIIKPKLILAGFSSYTRNLDWKKFKEIADSVGALTMADVSHIGGLIAGKVIDNPLDYGFDVMTTTTHKSLRGPRGGLILAKEKFGKLIDKSIFPGLQGGPLMNAVYAKLVCFEEALKPEFKEYSKQILKNAKVLAEELKNKSYNLANGGTENHMILIDLTKNKISGKEAEKALDKAGITVNKNVVPDDKKSPLNPSGIRLGTPAVTSRGMKEKEMIKIADFIDRAINNYQDDNVLKQIKSELKLLTKRFPVSGV